MEPLERKLRSAAPAEISSSCTSHFATVSPCGTHKPEGYNYHFQSGLLGVSLVDSSGSCRIFWQGLGLHCAETISMSLESKLVERLLARG